MRTYSFPGHIRGPPPNGKKMKGWGLVPSKQDGLNLSGFGKNCGYKCKHGPLEEHAQHPWMGKVINAISKEEIQSNIMLTSIWHLD